MVPSLLGLLPDKKKTKSKLFPTKTLFPVVSDNKIAEILCIEDLGQLILLNEK